MFLLEFGDPPRSGSSPAMVTIAPPPVPAVFAVDPGLPRGRASVAVATTPIASGYYHEIELGEGVEAIDAIPYRGSGVEIDGFGAGFVGYVCPRRADATPITIVYPVAPIARPDVLFAPVPTGREVLRVESGGDPIPFTAVAGGVEIDPNSVDASGTAVLVTIDASERVATGTYADFHVAGFPDGCDVFGERYGIRGEGERAARTIRVTTDRGITVARIVFPPIRKIEFGL